MVLNFFKYSLMVFKDDASACVGGVEVEERATQKVIGLMAHGSLT